MIVVEYKLICIMATNINSGESERVLSSSLFDITYSLYLVLDLYLYFPPTHSQFCYNYNYYFVGSL